MNTSRKNLGIGIVALFCIALIGFASAGVTYVPPITSGQSVTTTPFQTGQGNTTVNINNTNYIVMNITNNITTYINLTENITQFNIINITNNITNNYYAGWLTVNNINNITNNVTNNITILENVTNIITNNLTLYVNNMTTYVTNNVTTVNNFTTINNFTYYMQSLSKYLIIQANSSNIDFNETVLNNTITSLINSNNAKNYGEIYYSNLTGKTLILILANQTYMFYNTINYTSTITNGCGMTLSYYMTCNNSGIYEISYIIAGELDNNNYLYTQLYVNNQPIPQSIIFQKPFATESREFHSTSIINYTTPYLVDVRIANTQVNGRTFRLYNAKIIMRQIQ